jgi:hypothetical protein
MPIGFPNCATQSASRHPKLKSATIGVSSTEPGPLDEPGSRGFLMIRLDRFQSFFRFQAYNRFYTYHFAPNPTGNCSDCKVPRWNGVNQKKPPFGRLFLLL